MSALPSIMTRMIPRLCTEGYRVACQEQETGVKADMTETKILIVVLTGSLKRVTIPHYAHGKKMNDSICRLY